MKKIIILLALLLLLCCLTGCGEAGKSAEPTDAEEAALCTYTVICQGQEGESVEGVIINFCTDSLCSPVTSDEQGEAIFTGAAEAYHVQIVKVPEGWDLAGEEEWTTEPKNQSFRITFREVGK